MSHKRKSSQSPWVDGETSGYSWQAKVYDLSSRFGIGDGRVSKLVVWPAGESLDLAVYNYDRGLEFDNAPEGLIDLILAKFPDVAKGQESTREDE